MKCKLDLENPVLQEVVSRIDFFCDRTYHYMSSGTSPLVFIEKLDCFIPALIRKSLICSTFILFNLSLNEANVTIPKNGSNQN